MVSIWRGLSPEQQNDYYYTIFMPTFQAASTQDPQALPLLEFLLADDQGYVSHRPMPCTWSIR